MQSRVKSQEFGVPAPELSTFSLRRRPARLARTVSRGEGLARGVKRHLVRPHERERAAAGRVAVPAALFIAEIPDAPGGEILDRLRLQAPDFEKSALDAACDTRV